ncbi:MAG: SPASM domain-containing protein [Alphaproteobacteria bacterium]|nr:SPASM domain-containing protein [Alphaproteobacteria bacterium]
MLAKQPHEVFRDWKVCPIPFVRMQINMHGNVLACCPGHMKEKFFAGNVLEQSLDEIWNGEVFRMMRKALHSHMYEQMCSPDCPVYRRLFDQGEVDYAELIDDQLANEVRLSKTKLATPYLAVNIASDPSCNLKCIMCRKELISKPTEEEDHVNEVVFDQVLQNIEKIKLLKLTGHGEVFFKKSARRFLERLQEHDTSHLKLTIITNGTLVTEERWAQLLGPQEVRELEIEVSIDAASKETYEKIRLGGSWDRLIENLRMLADKRAAGEIHSFLFNYVVMKSNVGELADFVRLADSLNVDQVRFTRIFDWEIGDSENFFKSQEPRYLEVLAQQLARPELNQPNVDAGPIRGAAFAQDSQTVEFF